MAKKKADEQALAEKPNPAITALGCVPKTLEETYRYSQAISRIGFIPPLYKNNPDNCFLAVDLSLRWRVHWLTVMQHLYLVHERPALDAVLTIALTNSSGLFVDPIEYEIEGDDAKKDDYRVRAYATRKSTGKTLKGPWIDWAVVRGEGWDKKSGSKWLSMPDQMFHYRAASWFQRRFCPEVSMGMITTDEAQDAGPRHVESTVVEKGVQGLKDRLKEREETAPETTEPAKGEDVDADTAAEVARQKADLAAAEQEDAGAGDDAETEDEAGADDVDLSGDTASIFD